MDNGAYKGHVRPRRLEAERELELARQANAAEARARRALKKVGVSYRPGVGKALAQAVAQGIEDLGAAQQAWAEVEECRWELALSGYRLAEREARRWAFDEESREDLAHEGVLGLLEAARRFDPARGLRFSTYAAWWVRAHIRRARMRSQALVRLSEGAEEQLRRLVDARRRLVQAGASDSVEAVAAEARVPVVRAHLLLGQGPSVSIDDPDLHLHLQSDALAPDEVTVARDRWRRLEEVSLERLTDKERYVLEYRFGLLGRPQRTLLELGEELGCTREWIRRLEKGALEVLRNDPVLALA